MPPIPPTERQRSVRKQGKNYRSRFEGSLTASHRGCALVLGINDTAFTRRQQACDPASIRQSSPDDLDGVQNTLLDHVTVFPYAGIVTVVELRGVLVQQGSYDDGTFLSGVLDDGPSGSGDGGSDDGNAELLVKVGHLDVVELEGSLEQSGTSTGNDALLDGGSGGVESIVVPVLLLPDLDLAGSTDLDDGDSTGQLGQSLLQLGPVVLARGHVVHDPSDLFTSPVDHLLGTFSVQKDGVLLGNGNAAGRTEQVGGGALELDVELFGKDLSTGQDGQVTEDGLSVVSESGGLDGTDRKLTTELVEDTGREGLAVNVLGDDQEGPPALSGNLERGQDVLQGRDLAFGQQDQRSLHLDLLRLDVGDKVGRDESSVEPHPLGDLDLILDRPSLLDGDDTLLADLLHGLGDDVTDVDVTVGGDGSDLGDLFRGGDDLFVLFENLEDLFNGLLGASSEVHGVASCGT